MQQYENKIYEEIMRHGREEGFGQAQDFYGPMLEETNETQLEVVKSLGDKEGYERGLKDGEEKGRTAKQEKWEMKRERDEVDEGMQTESETSINGDTSTQTMSTCTVDATMQTVPNDKMPHLLNDAGMSTELPSTCETGIQANETPTSLSTPAISTMSSLMTPAQPPSITQTTLTMATTTTSPCFRTTTSSSETAALAPRPNPQSSADFPAPPFTSSDACCHCNTTAANASTTHCNHV
jgi:hypothetical protein